MSELKQSRYGGRLDSKLRERLDKLHAKYLTNDSAVIQALLSAFCDEAERIDAVRFPITLRMAEAHTHHEELRAAAEDGAAYGKAGSRKLILPAETAVRNELAGRGKKPSPASHK